jgi:hypothetical protein
MKGLMVTILRSSAGANNSDCTNNGLTSHRRGHRHVVLVGEGIPEIFEATEDMPAVVLVKRELWSDRLRAHRIYYHVEPAETHGQAWHMAGGHFIYDSDSRFPCDYPISVHDRIEG